MGLLLLHFVCLLFKLVDSRASRSDVSLEFFDFVVQNKLELLQLLGLFLEVVDAFVLVSDRGLSL